MIRRSRRQVRGCTIEELLNNGKCAKLFSILFNFITNGISHVTFLTFDVEIIDAKNANAKNAKNITQMRSFLQN